MARLAAASFLASFALVACSPLRFVDVASDNQSSRIEHVVMHFTSVDFAQSMRMLTERTERPVSAHYLVPENGDPTYPRRRLSVYRRVRSADAGRTQGVSDAFQAIGLVRRAGCRNGRHRVCAAGEIPPPGAHASAESVFVAVAARGALHR